MCVFLGDNVKVTFTVQLIPGTITGAPFPSEVFKGALLPRPHHYTPGRRQHCGRSATLIWSTSFAHRPTPRRIGPGGLWHRADLTVWRVCCSSYNYSGGFAIVALLPLILAVGSCSPLARRNQLFHIFMLVVPQASIRFWNLQHD